MAAVNDDLVLNHKCAPVDAAEIDRIKAAGSAVWTSDVKAAYAAKQTTEEDLEIDLQFCFLGDDDGHRARF